MDDSDKELPHIHTFFEGGLTDICITYKDVYDQLLSIDTNKSYGPDGVSPRLLKEGGAALATPLLQLYQMSIKLGKFPKLWKQANVVPIHKKDKLSLMTNYRPISLLSGVGKILERIVFKYVFNFFRENFIISLFQSGFLPGMSTVTQLLEVYHNFVKAVDDGKEIRVVFLDISKAFDKVWHKGLIAKLQKCGIQGRLLDWFIDYLSDRFQRVVINGQHSEWGQIKAGVPQGSVLGPLLFLLFINDIVSCISHCKIRLFADDTCLFIEVDNRESSAMFLSEDLSAVADWAQNWLVTFSPAKTKSLTISNKRDAQLNPPIPFMGRLIEEVESHTYLGLRFSRDLKWRHHINDISIKTRRKLNLMSPLKMRVDRQSLEIMYKSFVQATMEYANIVWGGSYDTDINKLEQIHLDAMRLITGATARSNITNVHSEFCGYTVTSRINQACLTMMFKIISGRAPLYLLRILSELNEQNNYSL